jgi:hypothetical protein
MKLKNIFYTSILLICFMSFFMDESCAQMNFDGDFRFRWYSDKFTETMDQRDKENYVRYLGRIRANVRSTKNITFNTEVTTVVENPNTVSARNIAGTGKLNFKISKIYAELTEPNFLYMDVVRVRLGRQPFGVGSGLSFGESYYFLEKFDGARVDMAYKNYSLTLFGAITGQNLSESGLYPEPGSDQIYTARLTADFFNQSFMGYFINQKNRGLFNDNYIIGGGISGAFLSDRLDYFIEVAKQDFNTPPSFSDKGGIGYMGGVGYRWSSVGPFRSIKLETRYAAYQGDDATTPEQEIFSPPFPSFFWGDRMGYVSGEIGGAFPNRGRNPEGSKIWYSRVYVIPKILPDMRIQLQYLKIKEYVDNDNYNTFDDEISARIYYKILRNVQLQFRYSRGIPNGEDKDVNNSGTISSTEDRYSYQRFMLEMTLVF